MENIKYKYDILNNVFHIKEDNANEKPIAIVYIGLGTSTAKEVAENKAKRLVQGWNLINELRNKNEK